MPDNAPEITMKLKPGAPASAISRHAVQLTVDFIKYLTIRNGRLLRNGNRFTIECIGTGGTYTGNAYTPAGILVTGLTDTSKPWVKHNLSTGAITEETGPPSTPWGASETWRKKSDFAGAIYF